MDSTHPICGALRRHIQMQQGEPSHLYRPYNSSNHPLVGRNDLAGYETCSMEYQQQSGLHCEMWIDESPINPSGGFNNNWKKVWIYEEQRSRYSNMGWTPPAVPSRYVRRATSSSFSCHEIIPPGNATSTDYTETDARSQTAPAEVLAEKAEYEETTGYTHPDYIAEMIDIGIKGGRPHR